MCIKSFRISVFSPADPYMLIGEWTPDTSSWIGAEYWGLVSQDVEPV